MSALPEAWQNRCPMIPPRGAEQLTEKMPVSLTELREFQAALRGRLLIDEPMARHSTFRIGGNADIFLQACGMEDARTALAWAKEKSLPLKVIGNGSNLLVSDRGIRGLVVHLGPGFDEMVFAADGVTVGAGVKLALVVNTSAKEGLSGLESTAGIPGTMGGALATNAGTDTGSIGDLVVEVTALDQSCNTAVYPRAELVYRYRWSSLSGAKLIILGAKLALQPSTPEEVRAKISRLLAKRAARQPIHHRSAGSIFKNPEAIAAGKLLDRAGAKGLCVGEAEVSLTHANFIINRGQAKAADVRALLEMCQQLVLQTFGVQLEPEVEFVGEW